MFLTSGSSESVVVQTEYQVQRSLRIRSGAGAYLSRTPTVDGDRKKFTFSAWVKLGSTTSGALLSSDFASTGGLNEIYFSNGSIAFYFEGSGTKGLWYTTGFFRDPTAWYHVVVVADSTQAVTANMASIYVNGIKQTIAFTNLSSGTPAQNTNWWITSTVAHRIGNSATQSNLQFDGYIADMYFVDGQTLTPTSFGEYSAYGHWKPKVFVNQGWVSEFGNSTVSDQYYSNVSLLLHGNGTNGSTSIVDSSATSKTVTAVGTVIISTSQSKFGSGSMYFDGSGSYAYVNNSSDFEMGSGDYTVECWYYPLSSASGSLVMRGTYGAGTWTTPGYGIRRVSDTYIVFYFNCTGAAGTEIYVAATVTELPGWNHVAMCVNNNVGYAFLNGNLVGTRAATGTIGTGTDGVTIGKFPYSAVIIPFNGYIDDVRITKGVARYTSNFSPIGGYGTTGFYLPFSNVTSTTTLCADASGNGNNWVSANISLTSTSLYSITGFDVTRGAGAFGNATLPSVGDGTNCYHFPKTNSTYTINRTITAATKIEVYCYTDNSTGSNPCTITANGGVAKTVPANSTSFGWAKVDLGVTSLSSITVSNSASWAGSDFWLCCFIADNSVVYAYSTDSTYDGMYDVPLGGGSSAGNGLGNYVTWNPLYPGAAASTDGNLNYSATGTSAFVYATQRVPAAGKFYFEAKYADSGGGISYIGTAASVQYRMNGQIFVNNVYSSTVTAFTTGDVIGCAFDATAQTWAYYKNNSLQVTLTGLTALPNDDLVSYVNAAGCSWAANFGQQPFTYTPPAGYKALHTGNLYTPAITTPKMYHNTYTYLGNGAGLQVGDATSYLNSPDLVWIKNRSAAQSHTLFDSVRGVGNILSTDTTAPETTDANSLTQFNINGFYLGSSAAVNTLNNSYVAWAWKASSPTVTNTAGSITSQVCANPTSGFSVVTYTGNGVDGSTVGHGLGVTPNLVIVRTRNNGGNFRVMHTSLAASTNVYLNATNAADVITVTGGGGIATTPSSTMFTLTTGATSNANNVNASAWTYVAYCFAEIAGYSKFGSYTGNGSTDGPFVYCGFRPASVMIKRTDVVDNWYIWDTTRNPSNVVGEVLYLNLTNAAASSNEMDIIATGFKIRSTATADNASGGTYIFIAFAEAPLKYSLAR